MPAFARVSRAAAVALMALPAWAEPDGPSRVVSMNVCTDQLAMLLAGEDQLASVSFVAADPHMSAMADEAATYPLNHAGAEEIYLLDPDLVVTGDFSTRPTAQMLRRLGIPVETFAIPRSLAEIPGQIRRMGRVLGREGAAEALVADFEAVLAERRPGAAEGPRAALYAPNGYTSGDASLSGQILSAAGFDNVADDVGLGSGGQMPLELLALSAPDVVLTSSTYPGGSRAEAILDHPVVTAFQQDGRTGAIRGADWTCGTPHVLSAIADLVALRRQMARQ